MFGYLTRTWSSQCQVLQGEINSTYKKYLSSQSQSSDVHAPIFLSGLLLMFPYRITFILRVVYEIASVSIILPNNVCTPYPLPSGLIAHANFLGFFSLVRLKLVSKCSCNTAISFSSRSGSRRIRISCISCTYQIVSDTRLSAFLPVPFILSFNDHFFVSFARVLLMFNSRPSFDQSRRTLGIAFLC